MATPRIRFRDTAGTLRTTTQCRGRDAGNTLRTFTRVRQRDQNNVLRIVYDPAGTSTLTATPNTTVLGGFGVATATTNASCTVTAAGGTAPYTYAWTRVSSSHPTTNPTALSPGAATSAFRQTNMTPAESYTSTFRCTVTDSAANTATCDIEANFMDVS